MTVFHCLTDFNALVWRNDREWKKKLSTSNSNLIFHHFFLSCRLIFNDDDDNAKGTENRKIEWMLCNGKKYSQFFSRFSFNLTHAYIIRISFKMSFSSLSPLLLACSFDNRFCCWCLILVSLLHIMHVNCIMCQSWKMCSKTTTRNVMHLSIWHPSLPCLLCIHFVYICMNEFAKRSGMKIKTTRSVQYNILKIIKDTFWVSECSKLHSIFIM